MTPSFLPRSVVEIVGLKETSVEIEILCFFLGLGGIVLERLEKFYVGIGKLQEEQLGLFLV